MSFKMSVRGLEPSITTILCILPQIDYIEKGGLVEITKMIKKCLTRTFSKFIIQAQFGSKVPKMTDCQSKLT